MARKSQPSPKRKSTRRPLRVLWIPGLGADQRMYEPLTRALEKDDSFQWDHHFVTYPQDARDLAEVRSLEDLASLTLQSVIETIGARDKSSKSAAGKKGPRIEGATQSQSKKSGQKSKALTFDLIVGVSMGGMIAQILVGQNRIFTRNLALISTAYSGEDLRGPFRQFSWLPAALPGPVRRGMQWSIGKAYPFFRPNVREARKFAAMFLEFPQKIFFEAPRWIRNWNGEAGLQASLALPTMPADTNGVRLFRLHGTGDPLLSYERITRRIKIDRSFPGEGHIVFATRADTIARELIEMLQVSVKGGSRKAARSQRNASSRGQWTAKKSRKKRSGPSRK